MFFQSGHKPCQFPVVLVARNASTFQLWKCHQRRGTEFVEFAYGVEIVATKSFRWGHQLHRETEYVFGDCAPQHCMQIIVGSWAIRSISTFDDEIERRILHVK